MCLVQINFVVVGLNRMYLGLHRMDPLVDFSFQGFKYETLLCLEERRAGTLKWILWWKVNMTSIYKGQGLRFMS